jgi:hypothetical protein
MASPTAQQYSTMRFRPCRQPSLRGSCAKSERPFHSGDAGGRPSASLLILGIFLSGGAVAASGTIRRLTARVTRDPMRRRVMSISSMRSERIATMGSRGARVEGLAGYVNRRGRRGILAAATPSADLSTTGGELWRGDERVPTSWRCEGVVDMYPARGETAEGYRAMPSGRALVIAHRVSRQGVGPRVPCESSTAAPHVSVAGKAMVRAIDTDL